MAVKLDRIVTHAEQVSSSFLFQSIGVTKQSLLMRLRSQTYFGINSNQPTQKYQLDNDKTMTPSGTTVVEVKKPGKSSDTTAKRNSESVILAVIQFTPQLDDLTFLYFCISCVFQNNNDSSIHLFVNRLTNYSERTTCEPTMSKILTIKSWR